LAGRCIEQRTLLLLQCAQSAVFGDEVGTEPAPAEGDEFTANFLHSKFYGGTANFQRAVFNGHANFARAQLKSNSADFDQTKFNGRLTFSVSFAAA